MSTVEPLEGFVDSKLRGAGGNPLPSPLAEDDSPTEVENTYNPAWGPVYVAPPKKQRTKPKLSVTWASDESLEQVRVFVSDLETEVLSALLFLSKQLAIMLTQSNSPPLWSRMSREYTATGKQTTLFEQTLSLTSLTH